MIRIKLKKWGGQSCPPLDSTDQKNTDPFGKRELSDHVATALCAMPEFAKLNVTEVRAEFVENLEIVDLEDLETSINNINNRKDMQANRMFITGILNALGLQADEELETLAFYVNDLMPEMDVDVLKDRLSELGTEDFKKFTDIYLGILNKQERRKSMMIAINEGSEVYGDEQLIALDDQISLQEANLVTKVRNLFGTELSVIAPIDGDVVNIAEDISSLIGSICYSDLDKWDAITRFNTDMHVLLSNSPELVDKYKEIYRDVTSEERRAVEYAKLLAETNSITSDVMEALYERFDNRVPN